MTVKTTTDPKRPSTARTPDHGCCGGETAVESQTDTSNRVDHEHHTRAVPSKAAKSSCCCGTKDSRPAT